MKEKVIAFLKKFTEKDKLLRILLSECLLMFCSIFFSTIFAVVFTVLVGVGKEIYNMIKNESSLDTDDLIADGIGILIGMIFAICL